MNKTSETKKQSITVKEKNNRGLTLKKNKKQSFNRRRRKKEREPKKKENLRWRRRKMYLWQKGWSESEMIEKSHNRDIWSQQL